MVQKNVKMLLGNEYELIEKNNDKQNKPDAWVKFKNNEIPVECKLEKFNEKALKQLKRYMNFYGSSYGIAVAQELAVSLPENIIFIKYNK